MKPFARMAFLLVAVTGASAGDLTPQDQAMLAAILAHETGSNDTCPRFKVIQSAVNKELNDAGLGEQDLKSDHFKYALLFVFDMIKHADRSTLCKEAWEKFGPNGTYRRQMLEGK